MTSIIKFIPLAGACDDGPCCSILQVDDFKLLLDCGWNESFNMNIIENIAKHIGQVNAIILTFPDLQHMGALPYLVKQINGNCPIYATGPVHRMGQLFFYDLFMSLQDTGKFDKFNLDDIDELFDKIIQVKHNQTITIEDTGVGLSITPMHAGRLIGGAAWKIVTHNEEGMILYAVDYNHKRERHLNGCSLVDEEALLGRPPQLLITDAYNAFYSHHRRKFRDELLFDKVKQTLHNDGNVLIVVDTAGRVLELAILLDLFWSSYRSEISSFSLAMISNVAYNVMEFAKSMVEWMCDHIAKMLEGRDSNPFQFKHLKICHNLTDLAKIPQPRCVLASSVDMESGFSRRLFAQWCSDPRNTVILTNRTSKGTLARTLIDNPNLSHITLKISRQVPIYGEELIRYEKEKLNEKQQRKRSEFVESSDESGNEKDENEIDQFPNDNELIKRNSGFFKQAKKNCLMFPYTESRVRWDDYGEMINPEDFRFTESNPTEEGVLSIIDQPEDEDHKDPVITDKLPTKSVIETLNLEIKCLVTYIDFEGRSDGSSMLKIIERLHPRELILIHADTKTTHKFAESIDLAINQGVKKSSKPVTEIHIPVVNQVVDITKERYIYQVRMTDSLMNSFKFSSVRDTEVCWIDAVVDYSVRDNAKVLSQQQIEQSNVDFFRSKSVSQECEEQMEVDSSKELEKDADKSLVDYDYVNLTPSLQVIPQDETPAHKTCFINKVLLSEFKKVLTDNGIQCEFIGGILVCNSTVAIKRNNEGVMEIEGCLSDDYFKIKSLLFKEYAII